MFFQTCAKLAFCLTQIYFLAITTWYRVYSMCFPISRNAILGFRKNMSQRSKGFQGNLDTTIIKNSYDWFCNSLNVRDYCKTFHSGITLWKVAISQGWTPQTINFPEGDWTLDRLDIFAKPKDRVPTDRKTHALYSIPCGDCEKVCLGQTKRQVCTRLKEHQRAVSNFNSLTAHNQLWLTTCVKQAITLRGKILETLPLRLRAHGNVFASFSIVPQSQGSSNLLPNNRKRCANVIVCT